MLELFLQLNIKKDLITNNFSIDKVNFLPTWVFKGNTDYGREYVILPSTSFIDTTLSLSKSDSMTMNQAFDKTRYIITKYSNNSRLKEKEIRLEE